MLNNKSIQSHYVLLDTYTPVLVLPIGKKVWNSVIWWASLQFETMENTFIHSCMKEESTGEIKYRTDTLIQGRISCVIKYIFCMYNYVNIAHLPRCFL